MKAEEVEKLVEDILNQIYLEEQVREEQDCDGDAGAESVSTVVIMPPNCS
jgi:hypothetical protein